MTEKTEFEREVAARLASVPGDQRLLNAGQEFMQASMASMYSYNWFWFGRPVIQYPQDIVKVQELIFSVRPDVIVETGIAHGGSLVLSASILALLDYAEAFEEGRTLDPRNPRRKVIGVDIDIRPHNRAALEGHPLYPRLQLIEGSSTNADIIEKVRTSVANASSVMVMLDSNHTHEHVLRELVSYAPLVTKGSYLVVFDTIVEDLPTETLNDRPWAPGNSPQTAVQAFLGDHPEFQVDRGIDNKLVVSVSPGGYLKRVR